MILFVLFSTGFDIAYSSSVRLSSVPSLPKFEIKNDVTALTDIFNGAPSIISPFDKEIILNQRRPVTIPGRPFPVLDTKINRAPSLPLQLTERVPPPRPFKVCGLRSQVTIRFNDRGSNARLQKRSPKMNTVLSAPPPTDPFFPIAGGVDAIRNSWPWMALLGERKGAEVNWFCDGVLINEEWVLTAAHCLDRKTVDVLRLGEHDTSSSRDGAKPLNFAITRTIVYPDYNPSRAYHDLALLKLSKKAPLSTHISPVCLPWGALTSRDLTGMEVTVTGWGSLKFGGPHHPILQEVEVFVNKTQDCDKQYKEIPQYSVSWPNGITSETTMCAAAHGKDSCPGDSGGPAVYKINKYHILAGVVSKGYGCANSYPGIYVQINRPKYLNWIKTHAF